MSKAIEDIDAALESAGRELANDMTRYTRSLIEKVDRPVAQINASSVGITVAWRGGVAVFVNPSGSYQVVGTELWMDEDEVAKRVIERLDQKKPAYESLCRQISDACAQISQEMRKKGVALLRELNEKQSVDSVSVDRQGLVLTLYGDTRRRVDAKVGVLGNVSVALDGVAVANVAGTGVTSSVQLAHRLLENKPLSSITNDSTLAATTQELGSAMKTAVSELGLRPEHGASAKSTELGWMLSFYCQAGRVEMLLCHDRSVLVKCNGKPTLQAPDVSMAMIYLKELLAEEKKTPSVDELALEIQSHLANDTGHLIRQLGLKPGEYSLDIVESGLKISFDCKAGHAEATVCCNGKVIEEINGERTPCALEMNLSIPRLEHFLAENPKRQIEEEAEEETAKKSPKITVEEEPVPPTQLVNLE